MATVHDASRNSILGPADPAIAAPQITVTNVGSARFHRPVSAVAAPGDPDRLYVVEQHTGRILILDTLTGKVNAAPFLDLPDSQLAQGPEQGMLGLAFHPGYAANGRFFVYLTNAAGDIVVRSYHRSAGDPDRADPASGNVILTIDRDNGATNHNGGWMGFGPDRMLYVAVGDEGLSGDPANNAQNVNVLWGKMLRINVNGDDFAADANRDYAIPDDNPFAGVAGADEIWALGLRNPWRASFDRLTGDLYIADVGQAAREEINVQPAGSRGGANYGWKVKEGRLVYDASVPGNPRPDSPVLVDPVVDYAREGSPSAVVGGYVYRGDSVAMQGRYLFADFLTNRLWSFRLEGTKAVDLVEHTRQLVLNGGSFSNITSFAEDGHGNIYVLGIRGKISRLDFGAASGAIDGPDRLHGDAPTGADGSDRFVFRTDTTRDLQGMDAIPLDTGFEFTAVAQAVAREDAGGGDFDFAGGKAPTTLAALTDDLVF